MQSSSVLTSETQNLLVIEMNRPQVRNAFNPEMIEALTDTFSSASTKKELSGILLFGAGESFCAGADLSWMQTMAQYSQDENLADSQRLHAMFAAIWECPHPIISYAHGSVFGGGLGILACSDLVVADPATKFCFSEVRLGLSPAVISQFIALRGLLPTLRSAMTFGNIFSTAEAMNYGLAQFSETWTDPTAKALDFLVRNGVGAMHTTKQLLRELPQLDFTGARTRTTECIAKLRVAPEAQGRLKKFLDGSGKKGAKA